MKKTIVLFFLLLLYNCQYFEKKVIQKEVLLHQEINKINWTEVDEYPSVKSCDSIHDQETRKKCFFDFVSNSISTQLNDKKNKNSFLNIDSLKLKVVFLANSKVVFEVVSPKNIGLDSIVKSKLENFPEIEPAIKRSMKVKTTSEFTIAIKH
jgi:hypothetical protein